LSPASDISAFEGWSIVNSLLMPFILCFTVVASVSFGVLAAYAAVFAILSSFGQPQQPENGRPRLVLVPTQNHASGD
jgi:hypothetical protein